MVTSIRVLDAAIGSGVPLTTANVLYWVGGARPGFAGFLLTIALFGVALGGPAGAAYAHQAVNTTRPIFVAAKAASWV